MNDEGVNLTEMQQKVDQAIQFLQDSIRGIRGGMISPSFVGTFKVPYHGNDMLISHVAQTTAGKGQVMVKPFESSLVGPIQKVLKDAGLNAYVYSKDAVAVSVPPPTGEDTEKIKARVKKLGEETKISVRSVRRQYRNRIDSKLPEDVCESLDKQIQEITDEAIAEIEMIVEHKLSVI